MSTPSPKDVPMGEVWEVASPKIHSKERWIAVRNSPSGLSPWHMVSLNVGGYRHGEDGEIALIRRLTPEVNDDDPIVFAVHRSDIDVLDVTRDVSGNWLIDGRFARSRGHTEELIESHITDQLLPLLVESLAIQYAMEAGLPPANPALETLRQVAPDGDEATLAVLAADPSIIAALGGGRDE